MVQITKNLREKRMENDLSNYKINSKEIRRWNDNPNSKRNSVNKNMKGLSK
jgi:hypothetical protein